MARSSNRLESLLDGAAELFSTRGYHATTMRDIALKSGMRPGSIYYHYPNKEALLVAVYGEGVARLSAGVSEVLEDASADPWSRLEKMLAAHTAMLVEPTAYPSVVVRILPGDVPAVRDELTALRDGYEAVLKALVGALDLAPEIDRRLFRLFLIGAINHVPTWYGSNGATPAAIAHELVRTLRCTSRISVEGS